jgi:hypothetical protein
MWVIFMIKNFHNRTKIIAKRDFSYLGEEILESIMAPKVKHTLVYWRR